ncbi:DNA cytosine methyltransferase [Nocardiopsis sp. CC223A]|uniref:DNA cytosine methyltransferase n=1 Tax=Nocardiopsis sp. CC223A TaxID=3044051 RepID=UPI00355678FA
MDTHNTNHPSVDHDCFVAGTLILTAAGMRPIEEIRPGELVLTHKGRWRPVVRKFEKQDRTVIAKAALHAAGTEVTPNHEFWTRRTTLRSAGNDYAREYGTPRWAPIGDAHVDRVRRAGHHRDMLAFPVAFGELPWLEAPEKLGADPVAAWWLIGRWLGDGSSGNHNGDVTICCGRHETEELRRKIPPRWRGRETNTAYVFYDYNRKLADWLREHFGSGAAGKGIPGWALTMPESYRRALLAGYVSADGSQREGVTRTSTISKSLALSVRMLAHSLGYKASLHYIDRGPSCVIQGRTVTRQPVWSVHWREQPTRQNTMTDELHCWAYVQEISPGQEDVPVYTMEVAEDHSYVADGLVVKNCADLSQVDPRRYPTTDIAWLSPSCTNHSIAKGIARRLQQPDLFDETAATEAAERSRATMWDAIRFAEHHRYRALIVENVVDVCSWVLWPAWCTALLALGYEHRVVSLNSMHAAALGPAAPQSRDRVYVVAWRSGDRAPDLDKWIRPTATCPTHGPIRAVQSWKGKRQVGKYRSQYLWRCPRIECRHRPVEPAVRAAAEIVDWSLPAERIGDRARPLAAKTMARIRDGLAAYGRPLLVPVEGRQGKKAAPACGPLRTLTTCNETGLAVPPFVAELRGGGSKHRPLTSPLSTVCASGNHHGLTIPDLIAPYYGTASPRPADQPLPTVTTVERHGLLPGGTVASVEELRFRMLTPGEYAAAMSFPDGYVLLGNKRERVRMTGNAVTPPAARDLVAAVAEALAGEEITPAA